MNTFLLIFNALPTIIQAVQTIETSMPLPQSGQQKLNLILGAAGTAWDLGQVAHVLPKSNTVEAIQTITNLTVASLNASGIFKHSTPVAKAA